MEKEFITRKEAAEILGVSQQTITNYISRGMFGYKTVGVCKNVCKEDVLNMKAYVSDSREASANAVEICEKMMLSTDEEFIENHRKLKAAALQILTRRVLGIIEGYNKFSKCLSDRELNILSMYLGGKQPLEIANIIGITLARVNKIVSNSVERLNESMSAMIEKFDDISTRLDDEKEDVHGVLLYSSLPITDNTSIEDVVDGRGVSFSVRAVNAMHTHGINKVGELLETDPEEMRKWINLGKVTMQGILDVVKYSGLKFRTKVTAI